MLFIGNPMLKRTIKKYGIHIFKKICTKYSVLWLACYWCNMDRKMPYRWETSWGCASAFFASY
jgi:hypothetical protein